MLLRIFSNRTQSSVLIPDLVAHTWESEAGGLPRSQNQPGPHNEFQASTCYRVRPVFKKYVV